jgi:hypothetical protein
MHTGGGGEGHIMNPLKQFKKLGHKNAIKHENRYLHLGRFSHNPSTSLKRICKKSYGSPWPYLEFQQMCLYVDV